MRTFRIVYHPNQTFAPYAIEELTYLIWWWKYWKPVDWCFSAKDAERRIGELIRKGETRVIKTINSENTNN